VQFLAYFSLHIRRNAYLRASGQKSDLAIRDLSYKTDGFPLQSDVYCDLDLWPFALESVSYTVLLMSDHIPIIIILWLSVTELRVLNIWSHFRYLKQSMRMRRVTWPLIGGKNSPHFWNPWPQFSYSLCHFHGATTKIKPCYRQKIEFSYYEGYKVYCA